MSAERIPHSERITIEVRPRAPRLRHGRTVPMWAVLALVLAYCIAFYLVGRP